MSEERLQKILARAGIASRRKAEELIREGRVTVNGQPAAIGDKADLERDSVKLDERRIQAPAVHRYLLLNKPRGVMSTVSDPAGRPTVIDLVPPALRRALVPVGRLDFQTEGLLLLTDDGDLAQHVAHPSFGCWKTYEVKVRGRPADEQIERLRSGIVLEGRRTAPCRIAALPRSPRSPRSSRSAKPARAAALRAGGGGGGGGGRRNPRRVPEADTSSWWSVELGEGRTRQIREMFQRIGHPVQKLRRIAIGPVSDPDIPVGSLRELSEREVAALRRAGPPVPRRPPSGRAESPVPRRPPGGRPASPGPQHPGAGLAASTDERRTSGGHGAGSGPRHPPAGRAASGRIRRPLDGRGSGPSPRRPPGGRAVPTSRRASGGRAASPGPRRPGTGRPASSAGPGRPSGPRRGSPAGRRGGPGRPGGGSRSRPRRGRG